MKYKYFLLDELPCRVVYDTKNKPLKAEICLPKNGIVEGDLLAILMDGILSSKTEFIGYMRKTNKLANS